MKVYKVEKISDTKVIPDEYIREYAENATQMLLDLSKMFQFQLSIDFEPDGQDNIEYEIEVVHKRGSDENR